MSAKVHKVRRHKAESKEEDFCCLVALNGIRFKRSCAM